MEYKENNKRNNKTIRNTENKQLSFNQITKFDKWYDIPINIIWMIEQDLDKGAFELVKYYNLPVRITFHDISFDKQPPFVLTNTYQFNSQGNSHNLVVNNVKRTRIFYYLENGTKHEYYNISEEEDIIYFEPSIKEEKDLLNNYFCKFCNTTHKTKESFINHRTTKTHIDNIKKITEVDENKFIENKGNNKSTKRFLHDYIALTVKPNNKNFYNNSEFRKRHSSGCACCRLNSSSALTKGHGNKSARKTKGRQKREKEIFKNID